MGRVFAIAVLLSACSFDGPPGPGFNDDGLGPDDVEETLDSCLDYFDAGFTVTGVYPIRAGFRSSFQAHCDMATEGGGWTLALKIDGSADTFEYGDDNGIWRDAALLNEASAGTTREEAKLATFTEVGFTEVLVRFESDTLAGSWPRHATIQFGSPLGSLHQLFDGPGPTPAMSANVGDWRAMVEGVTLQDNCNAVGVNNENGGFHRSRIGVEFNNEDDCASNDSGVGLGFQSDQVDPPAAGAENVFEPPGVMEVFALLYVR